MEAVAGSPARGGEAGGTAALTPAINMPISSRVDPGVCRTDDHPLVHDKDAIADGHYLVQVLGDDQHRCSVVTLHDKAFVDVAGRAHVNATSGLSDEQDLGAARQLTGHDQLLDVPAREVPGRSFQRRRPHVESGDQLLAVTTRIARVRRNPSRE